MGDDVVEMSGFLSMFEGYYRQPAEVRERAFKSGLIVFDTNALLDLYRFGPAARADFLAVIRAVHDRTFVPHQVAREFHERRVDAVADRSNELDQQRVRLQELRQQTVGIVRQLSKRAHGNEETAEQVEAGVDAAFSKAADFLEAVAAGYDLSPDNLASSPPDPIVVELDKLFEGRVGAEPEPSRLEEDRREAKRRADEKIPPGFRDSRKSTGGDGDYLWWAEVLRYAEATRPHSVVIVSNDVSKGDWIRESRGFRIGPAPFLVAEMLSASGATLHWATTSDFLSEVAQAIGYVGVREETLEEARSSHSIAVVVGAIREFVRDSERPPVSSAVANVALTVDPTLAETAWDGAGSFRSFLELHAPDLSFIPVPKPGYVLDPDYHSEEDLPAGPRTLARGLKVRVYELARELGLTNQETVDLCNSLGIGVKSHSSSIVEPQADRVRRKAEREGLVRSQS